MTLEEREKFLVSIISELTEKVEEFTDQGAIAFTKRIIAESERDLKVVRETMKARAGAK